MNLIFFCGVSVSNGKLRCASWIKSIISNLKSEYLVSFFDTSEDESSEGLAYIGNRRIQVSNMSFSDSVEVISNYLLKDSADVIVVFGTENPTHLKVLQACQQSNLLGRTVLFAQGLCGVCAQHYAEGIPDRIIRRYTFRDLLRRQNIFRERHLLFSRAEYEKTVLGLTHHFIGRTTMDKAILRKNNQEASYYKCNDVLRSSFYDGQWTYDHCIKHRVFISQYYYPLKGFHYLLDAVVQLKKKYPDIMIAAAGYNPIQKPLPQKELKDSSYIKYIKSLIKKYDLQDHIELLGELSEERMKKEYLKANVFVMPSTIENSPNSMAEAMMLGVPTIASDVGGVTDFAKHQEEAYIYPSSATYLLAHYIDKVFSDMADAEIIGNKGKMRAEIEYNRENNIKRFEEIMNIIAKSG